MTEQRVQRTTCEVREDPGQPPVISGYAAVFNRDSNDMGFIEQVDPAAFNRTINGKDILGTFNHNADNILGRTGNGTMRVYTDTVGLRYEIEVNPADPAAQSVLAKVRRGDVQGSSFSFNTIRDDWNWETTPPQRRLLEVALNELGPVTSPAYPDATAAASRALQPIADRIGRPVGDLVAALGSGEIRSLVNGGTMTTETLDEEQASLDLELEERVGKTISAKTAASLQAFHDSLASTLQGLRDLIDVAQSGSPEGSDVGDAAVMGPKKGDNSDDRELMDTAAGGAPSDSHVTDSLEDPDEDDDENNQRGLSIAAAGVELRKRLLELDAA